jgi:hypothetical protein
VTFALVAGGVVVGVFLGVLIITYLIAKMWTRR